jgi:hypothetical protein
MPKLRRQARLSIQCKDKKSTDDLGTVIGIGGMVTGLYQKQMTLAATVYGDGDTKGIGLSLWDYSVLGSERLFLVLLV